MKRIFIAATSLIICNAQLQGSAPQDNDERECAKRVVDKSFRVSLARKPRQKLLNGEHIPNVHAAISIISGAHDQFNHYGMNFENNRHMMRETFTHAENPQAVEYIIQKTVDRANAEHIANPTRNNWVEYYSAEMALDFINDNRFRAGN